jgi:hypothetical protein
VSLLAGIWLTQVGDPRPHRQEGFVHGFSADRVVGLSASAVAEGKDEDVRELVFLSVDVNEAGSDVEAVAEICPNAEDLILGSGVLGSVSGSGCLQSNAEISLEAASGCSWSSCQGRACG